MGLLATLMMSLLLGLPEQQLPTRSASGEGATRQVEQDYALREQSSGSLEEFRAGSNDGAALEDALYLGVLGVGLLVALLVFGISALAKAAS